MILHWSCWPAKIVKTAARIKHHHHTRRIGHALKRTAGVVVSKPAAIVWVCIATGSGFWAGWPASLPEERNSGVPFSGPQFSDIESYAPSYAPTPDFPFPLPVSTTPTTPEQPQPEQPPQAVPEASSLALLALPVALAIIFGRERT